ncbi:MAG: hypothetical protein JWM93_3977 [Frankiales bacterium]|nr:hypothetical protein [Frankiales bacterium]
MRRESDAPITYPPLVVVEWVDATNIATWQDLDEIPDWAAEGGFVCRNVGYLVHEDDDCVVLAARIALDAEPQQVGLFERLPKSIITARWVVAHIPEDRP